MALAGVAVAGLVIAAGGAAETAHQAHVAPGQAKHAEQKQENALLQQQQAIKDEQAQNDAAKTSAVSLARQRAIQAVNKPSDYGGTLGAGSNDTGPSVYGGAKLLGV